MKNKTLSGIFLAGTLALTSVPAWSGIVVYTDQTSYNNNTTGLTASHVDLSNAQAFFGSSYTANGVTFVGNPTVFGSSSTSSFFNNEFFVYGAGQTTINLPSAANIYAISFYYGCTGSNCNQPNPRVITATSTTTTITPVNDANYFWPASQSFFYSFVSTSPLTQIVISGNAANFQPNVGIGNVNIGVQTAAATPEVATFLLIATGLGLMARLRRYTVSASPVTA